MKTFILIIMSQVLYSQEFFYNEFDSILKKHVDDYGRIHYRDIKNIELKRMIKIQNFLKSFNYEQFQTNRPQDDLIAFWINCYNFLIIKEVVQHYPISSIQDIKNVWKESKHQIGLKKYSLDYIEHELISKLCSDPRFHFALICAAYSCPKLHKSVFTGAALKKQFEIISHQFFTNDLNFHLDKKTNTVYVSKIFEWYKDNFKINKDDLSIREITLNYIINNATQEISTYLQTNKDSIQFEIMPWYWQLNQSL